MSITPLGCRFFHATENGRARAPRCRANAILPTSCPGGPIRAFMSATPAPAHILAARISFARGESLVTRRDQRGCPAPLERAFRACIRGTVGAFVLCAILIALSPTNAQA